MKHDITIRLSTDADVERLQRLAELDGRPVGGAVVADPFERTASVVRLLRTHLDGGESRGRRRRGWLRRVLPTP